MRCSAKVFHSITVIFLTLSKVFRFITSTGVCLDKWTWKKSELRNMKMFFSPGNYPIEIEVGRIRQKRIVANLRSFEIFFLGHILKNPISRVFSHVMGNMKT